MAGQEPQLQALRQAVTFAMTARDAMQGRLTEKQHILDEQASIIGNIEQRLERLLAMAKRLTPNPYTRTVEHEQLDMNPHSERGNEQTWCTLLVGLELQLNNVQQAIVTQESTSQELSRLEHELAQADAQLHATGLSRASAIQRMEALEMATIASQQSPSHGADATLRHLYAVGRLVQAAAAGRGADEWQSVHQLEQDAHTATNPDERAMLGVLHTVAMTIIDVFKTFETKAGQAAQQTQDRLSEALERVAECEAELEDAAFEHPDPELMSTITKREADRLEVKYSSLSKQHAQEVAGLKQLNTDLTARLDNITQEHAALKAKPPVGRFSASEWGDDSDQPDPSEELKARNKQVAKLTKKCEAAEAKLTELTDQLETERRAVGQEQQSIQSQSKAHKAELQANRDRAAQELKECRRHAENDLAQLQKELKTTQKEAAVNKDAATQLASKVREEHLWAPVEQALLTRPRSGKNSCSNWMRLSRQDLMLKRQLRIGRARFRISKPSRQNSTTRFGGWRSG
eukprot:TRINITY_DN2684_c0_g1_i3.p1 TRINITY_DN2684_c0_g1~~TRINITY_DN2684_c0_g1_i3.p1  ORF type:complete len:518 (-),score=106.93 TRINITY_DN2684_c0_g1_i3:737-2290(-)